ncbi:MAG: helix-turn-helix domain-containing protein [Bacteroidetes bacterium]|nr:helix-turn-helix domain-containing protein [Bacteroidota bacterium]
MTNSSVQIITLSVEDLRQVVMECIEAVFGAHPKAAPSEELLTMDEAARQLGIGKVTLWRLRRSGRLPSHTLGKRVYFKKSELIACLTPSRKRNA